MKTFRFSYTTSQRLLFFMVGLGLLEMEQIAFGQIVGKSLGGHCYRCGRHMPSPHTCIGVKSGGGSGSGYNGGSDPSMMMFNFFMNQMQQQMQNQLSQPAGPTPEQLAAEQAARAEADRRRGEQLRQARARIAGVFRDEWERREFETRDSLAGVFDVVPTKRSTAFFGIEGNPDTSAPPAEETPVFSDTSVVDLRDLPPGLQAQQDYAAGRLPFQAVDPGPAGAVVLDSGGPLPLDRKPQLLRSDSSPNGEPIPGEFTAPVDVPRQYRPQLPMSQPELITYEGRSRANQVRTDWQSGLDTILGWVRAFDESAAKTEQILTDYENELAYEGKPVRAFAFWAAEGVLIPDDSIEAALLLGGNAVGKLRPQNVVKAAEAAVIAERPAWAVELNKVLAQGIRPPDKYYQFPVHYRGDKAPPIPKWVFNENPYKQLGQGSRTWVWMDAEDVLVRRNKTLDTELEWLLTGKGKF